MGFRMRRISGMLSELRQPHIGEYATKTNAIRAHRRRPAAPWNGRRRAFEEGFLRLLLTVTDKDLIAGLGQLGPVLLQAVQNGDVAVVHHRTAEFLNVMGTGFLLLGRSAVLLLLGHSPGRNRQRQQGGNEERFTHCVPLILTAEILTTEIFLTRIARGISGADYSDGEGRRSDCEGHRFRRAEALVNAAKFAATISLNCGPRTQISRST